MAAWPAAKLNKLFPDWEEDFPAVRSPGCAEQRPRVIEKVAEKEVAEKKEKAPKTGGKAKKNGNEDVKSRVAKVLTGASKKKAEEKAASKKKEAEEEVEDQEAAEEEEDEEEDEEEA